MAEVLILLRINLNSFTKLYKFSKAIQIFFFLLPISLQAQIPDPCLSQWEELPYQSDSLIYEAFPDFLACCGDGCLAKKDSLLARAFHIKAILQLQDNELLQAVATNRKALAIRQKAKPLDVTDIGHSHLNLGFIFSHELHRYQQAKQQLDSAWMYLSQGKNAELKGDCMLERAILMQKQGDFRQGFLMIDQAIENYQQLSGPDRPFLLANAALARGELHTLLRDYDKASQSFREALRIYEDAGDLFEMAKVLHDLGHLEMQQQHWATALDFFQQGESVYTKLKKEYSGIEEALAYINEQSIKTIIGLGSCLIQLGAYAQAEKVLAQAMESTLPSQIELKASIADNQGDLYLSQQQFEPQAFSAFNTGLGYLFPAFHARSPLDYPKLTDSMLVQGQADLVLTLVQDKAKALKKAADSRPDKGKKAYLQAALQHYQLADQLSFRFRQNQQAEGSRLFWQQKNRAMYEAALELCYELDEPEKAFQLMENSKALVLLEAIKDAVAKASAGISEKDLLAEQLLKGEIAQLEVKLAGLGKNEEREALQKRLNELFLQQNELIENFKNRYPQYFTYKYGQWTKSAAEIQQLLGKTALIEFFEGKEAIYLCYLDREKLQLAKMDKADAAIESFMQAVKNPLLNAGMAQQGYKLYERLFQPLFSVDLPEKLYIVPDGQLTRIPFDALCTGPALVEGRPAFLLLRHTISYAYSASVLFQKNAPRSVPRHKLLAMAPGQFESLQLPPLPHSEQEVKNIVKMLGGKALLAEHASKAAFMADSKNYLLLHLSTHASADSLGSPWIAFRDSFLYLPAIYGLQTQARMVVLSACQTNQGRLAVGEGVMSLARAFRYAGVPSVLASMWEAEDASAAYIMEVFYKKLKAGLPKDAALSEAKRAYLAEADHYSFRSPFFWSNFVLVGDVDKLEELQGKKLGKNEVQLILGIFLTILVYLFFRTKNRRKYASNR